MKSYTKQSKFFPYYILFWVILLSIVIAEYLLFSPHIASLLFPSQKQARWQQLEQNIVKTGTVNARDFWQLREFYDNGNFTFNKTGVPILNNFLSQTIDYKILTDLPFLTYTSHDFKSMDFLITGNNMNRFVTIPRDVQVLVHKKNLILYKKGKEAYLLFTMPTSEMVKANGFLEAKRDEKILKDKYWMDMSMITLP
jgi:hypothetical protein